MATPNAQSGEMRENASPPPYGAEPESDRAVRYDIPRTSINPASDNWMGAASFVFAGISGIGLLVVVAGVYLADSDLAILIGVGIMCLAALGWAVVAVMMIGIIIKRWFAFSSTAGKASPRAKPE